jgi:Spy/CpxP family protein refolding chaperone
MHPTLMSCWRARRAFASYHGFGGWPGCRPRGPAWEGAEEGFEGGYGGGSFGVRRPLRFLAHKLALDEHQIARLARILDQLKTERAQAEVDRRRTVAAFADALTGDTFDAARAAEGGDLRLQSATRLREAVLQALQQIHALLNPDQHARLAYLIRTGALVI